MFVFNNIKSSFMVMCCVALWNAMSSQSALAAVDTAKDDAEIVFSFDAANGRREKRKTSAFEGNDVFIDIDPDEMKLGEQEISVEVVRKDGVEIGKKTLKFSRLEQHPKRPAWIDGKCSCDRLRY